MRPANASSRSSRVVRSHVDKEIRLTAEEASEIMDVLEEVVVSLDRVGSRAAAGDDSGHDNIWGYFTTDGVARRLGRARAVLAPVYDRTYTVDELEGGLNSRQITYRTDRHPDR